MNINIIGHAAIIIKFENSKILIDPVLNWLGSLLLVKSLSPENTTRHEKPIINEMELGNMLEDLDAVLYTNPISDCLEPKSFSIFANNIPILCYPKNENKLIQLGFRYVQPITDSFKTNSLTIKKVSTTNNKLLSKFSNPTQGFLLESPNEPTVYITGTSSIKKHIEKAVDTNEPTITIFNSKYTNSKKSVFSKTFVSCVHKKFPELMLLGLNMDSGNHYILSKKNVDISSKNNICSIHCT